MIPLQLDLTACRYRALIGVGGIGAGTFFRLNGNHTLGREESRSGRFLDRRDYCKLHIITHYVKALLGPGFDTLLIGKVGDDELGERLLQEMQGDGLNTTYVQRSPGDQTLYSICFLYPDGTGGNLTVDDSACAKVDAALVRQAEPEFRRYAGQGIALAAPEVPLDARLELLVLATHYRFFRAASLVSAEVREAIAQGMLQQLDLLALNVDEAAALLGVSAEGQEPQALVEATIQAINALNPCLWLSITAGKRGSWSWDGQTLNHVPALSVEVVGTAGAGDAHLGATLVGLTAGLSLAQAQELATLTAALTVTSPHTIHKGVNRASLRALAEMTQAPLSEAVWRLLG